MKKFTVFFIAVLLCSAALPAEKSLVSGFFTIYYPDTHPEPIASARAFNALRNHFNSVFRFSPDTSRVTNTIRILGSREEFDTYLQTRIGDTRDDYIFLKYSRPDLSELVLYTTAIPASGDFPFAGPSLNRQLFLQYLYSHVSEPPLWIRDGFQARFEQLVWDAASGEVRLEDTAAWLESVKRLRSSPSTSLSISQILASVTGSYETARLYPLSWAVVTFLATSEDPEYQRLLWESLTVLETAAPYNRENQQENTTRIQARFFRFLNQQKIEDDFSRWLSGQRTFNELMQDGVSAYNSGNYSQARTSLMKATVRSGRDPMLNYYLGLVAYAEKDYPTADAWYQKALEYGADRSTVNWALALSAYSDKRFAEARIYLETARTLNPARYKERVESLLKNIP